MTYGIDGYVVMEFGAIGMGGGVERMGAEWGGVGWRSLGRPPQMSLQGDNPAEKIVGGGGNVWG